MTGNICGSASTWIINNVLKNRGGLHNPITDQIHLLPFTLRECEELVRDSGLSMSRQEICALYMIFGGVRTCTCSWRHIANETYGKGAQIDLLIDRADNVINICEMKYSSGKYTLSKNDCESIDNKIDAFKAVSNTAKSIHLTLVTTNGLAENAYSHRPQDVLVLNDLFA